MVREIVAKVLLSSVRQPDSWFGLKYNMNLYRGCQHGCIYCDSRSECYGIDDFSDIQVKVNAIDLLRQELRRKRIRGTIGTGSMNDPYMPLEAERQLTRQALQLINEFRFPVHILTKSTLVLRDLDILEEISRIYARAKELEKIFMESCQKAGIATRMPIYLPQAVKQLNLALF